MSDAWRFVDAGAVDAPVSMGRMPAMAAGLLNGGPQVLMTGVFGRAHFQIGWFEDVDATMDLPAARALGMDVFRRPVWGGGTAFYDTNATALFSFFLPPGGSLDAALDRFRPVMRGALDSIGLHDAAFEGSSDIRWHGRKLGTVIAQDVVGVSVVGGFLNLRRPDMEVYAKIARVPPEKFADKQIKDAVEYVCTPADVRGTDLTYPELRDAVVAAARDIGGIDASPSPFTPEELSGADSFAQTVRSDEWVRRISSNRFREEALTGTRVGFANVKGRKLVRAGVALDDGGRIVRALMAGDMHLSPPDVLDRMASALEGADPGDRADVITRARVVLDAPDVTQPDQAAGITAEDCAEAVLRAAKTAG
ncbi:MAG: lipoate--protein ligase family protein [Actinomycetota bacterium]